VRQADEAFDSLIDILTVTLASEVKKCGAATEASPARSDLIGRIALRVIERLKELITRRREGADSGRDDQGAVERSCGHGWPSMELILPDSYPEFLVDLKDRIRTAQLLALPSVNRELVLLYCKSSARFSTAEP
jgi:hypothetical protein